jgi:uncharacterized protein
MNVWPEHIQGHTTHARRGAIGNTFRYSVDYVLMDPEADEGPALFSRNRWNLIAVHDRHHGGIRGNGRGVSWARGVFAQRGLALAPNDRVLLLSQPSFLGYVFNPVSFWLAFRGAELIAAIAEVNNTFGDRHSYFCAKAEFAPILPGDRIVAQKVFHVSPFQDVAGTYSFAFDMRPERISILIAFRNGSEGVFATLAGGRKPLSNASILALALRRPLGALRTILLIHWQALRLKLKRAAFRPRPTPPTHEVT